MQNKKVSLLKVLSFDDWFEKFEEELALDCPEEMEFNEFCEAQYKEYMQSWYDGMVED